MEGYIYIYMEMYIYNINYYYCNVFIAHTKWKVS